ncbi:hypothetical protein [Desulfovibrio sp. ZJ369]|uniref:hypothetical protein n=1 Tax=Desulfovibrio sp. ZJ369 TaxID=2709793 RepID=UPI001F154D55|nr:hypothetical protein [Desulfovibrio sp. ZJ369]
MRILLRCVPAAVFMVVAVAAWMCAGSAFAAAEAADRGARANHAPLEASGAAGTAAPAAGKEGQAPGQAAAAPAAKPIEATELWTGSLYSSTFRAALCFSAQGAVRGVLHLRLANGKTDVYHIVGTVKNNEIQASHSSGHTFRGRLLASDKVQGVISLKNGMKIKVDGKRLQDVPVTEDCAPLPQ